MTYKTIALDPRAKNITGMVYNRLTVIAPVGRTNDGHVLWRCLCSCGSITNVASNCLRSNKTQSCGCLPIENSRTHGMTKSSEYRSWFSAKTRCTNKNNQNYHHYGMRGISMCDRWIDSFEAFYDDMGPKPSKKHTLDRIDTNGPYSPENCRWATQKTQCRNKRNNKRITHNGRTKTVAGWAEELGINYFTLHGRLNRYGWSVEKAFNTPVSA